MRTPVNPYNKLAAYVWSEFISLVHCLDSNQQPHDLNLEH